MLAQLVPWIEHVSAQFSVGLLVGLVLGISSKFALRFLALAAGAYVIFELVRASGALGSL